MRFKNILKTAALAFALVTSGAHAALVNGNFETGDLTGYTVSQDGIGYVGVDYVSPNSGSFAAFFAGTDPRAQDTLSQTLDTEVGSLYSVRFFLQNEFDANPDNMFTVRFGDTVLLSLVNDAGFAYKEFVTEVVATASRTSLSFTGYNAPTAYDLDDIAVARIEPAPTDVPEPGTAALLGLGFAGIVGLRRKARAPKA